MIGSVYNTQPEVYTENYVSSCPSVLTPFTSELGSVFFGHPVDTKISENIDQILRKTYAMVKAWYAYLE